jgi:hypothetical protein
MTLAECRTILGLGIFFILFGTASLLWGKKEEKKYYNSASLHKDVKEYITHEPERLWLGAWQIGGKISLILGISLATAGTVLWLVKY